MRRGRGTRHPLAGTGRHRMADRHGRALQSHGHRQPAPDTRRRARCQPHRPRGRPHWALDHAGALPGRGQPPQHPAAGTDHGRGPAAGRRGALRGRARTAPGAAATNAGHVCRAGQRRLRPGLCTHHHPDCLHRRRHCHGLPGRLRGGQHGLHAVPPHRLRRACRTFPLPDGHRRQPVRYRRSGTDLPDLRSRARRRGPTAQ